MMYRSEGRVIHTTNYVDTLILPSEDCKANQSLPPSKPGTIGALQYELLVAAPYGMTSDDLLVSVTGQRREVPVEEWAALREELFSKGQACLRASPLVKTMGWAVHHDAESRVALIAVGSDAYRRLMDDPSVTKVKGMRNARA